MKILHVMAGAEHGGAEMACVDMCIAMHRAGEDVEVITRPNKVRVPLLEQAGIKVHTLPFGGAFDVYTPWAIGKIIKEFKPLIVQCWLQRAAKKMPNWKQVKSDQRYLVFSRLGGYYKKKNFKTTDYFVSITPDLKKHIEGMGYPEDKVRFIPNFAETETADAPVPRSDFDTPDSATLLLTLARYHENKALDIVIKSLKDLPDTYLWLAGDGPARGDLEALAIDEGVNDRVRFLGWRTDRAALLKAADICIFASRHEAFGTVFVQAWQQGTPVIVSDADGPSQFCTNDEDCLMVPRDDVGALVKAVKMIKSDDVLRDRIIENGLENYQSDFTKEQSVSRYLGFYHEALKRESIL